MKLSDATQVFRDAAIEKADFAQPVERDHRLHAEMAGAVATFRKAGAHGTAALRTLARDQNAYVRSWAATELLASGDVTARNTLEQLAVGEALLALSTQQTLLQHQRGELRSPFPERAN